MSSLQNAHSYRTSSPHPNKYKKTYRFCNRQHPNKCKKSCSNWDYITTQILLTKDILSYVIFAPSAIVYIIMNIFLVLTKNYNVYFFSFLSLSITLNAYSPKTFINISRFNFKSIFL